MWEVIKIRSTDPNFEKYLFQLKTEIIFRLFKCNELTDDHIKTYTSNKYFLSS